MLYSDPAVDLRPLPMDSLNEEEGDSSMRVRLFPKLLVAMLLVGMVPLTALGLMVRQQARSQMQATKDEELLLQLDRAAVHITAYVDKYKTLLVDTASTPAITSLNPQENQKTVMELRQIETSFEAILVTDASGMLTADTNAKTAADLVSLADRPYFKEVKGGTDLSQTTAISKKTGKPVLVLASAVKSDNQLKGMLGFVIQLTQVSQIVNEIKVGDTGYAWLADKDNFVMAHKDLQKVEQREVMKDHPALAKISTQATITRFTENGKAWLSAERVLPTGWKLVVQIEEAEALAGVAQFERSAMITFAVLLPVILLIAFWLARTIVAPVVQVAGSIKRLADGDLTIEESKVTARDEIGDTARAFNNLLQNWRSLLQDVVKSSEGTAGAARQLTSTTDQVSESLNSVATAMTQVAKGSLTQTGALSETSAFVGELRNQIQRIAAGTDQLDRSAQGTASTVANMVADTDNVSQKSDEVWQMANEASNTAQAGSRVVRETIEGMSKIRERVLVAAEELERLADTSSRIGDITGVITDIAAQTNLLALNAAIEAARAGEQGRGFAVVADEVRKLAERAGTSAREIADLIRSVQSGTAEALAAMRQGTSEVEAGTQAADGARTALQEIVAMVEQTSTSVAEISELARQISLSSRQVATAVDGMATVAAENRSATESMTSGANRAAASVDSIAATSEQNAAAAEQVSASVEEVSASTQEIRTAVADLAQTAGELMKKVRTFKV